MMIFPFNNITCLTQLFESGGTMRRNNDITRGEDDCKGALCTAESEQIDIGTK